MVVHEEWTYSCCSKLLFSDLFFFQGYSPLLFPFRACTFFFFLSFLFYFLSLLVDQATQSIPFSSLVIGSHSLGSPIQTVAGTDIDTTSY